MPVGDLLPLTTRSARAYNLEIADIHTNYVLAGSRPVLVHNTCGIPYSPRQVQKKFKHASDFDVAGNYSSTNGQRFQAAIEAHVRSAETIELRGSYRGDSARFYYNIQTRNAVITDLRGISLVDGSSALASRRTSSAADNWVAADNGWQARFLRHYL